MDTNNLCDYAYLESDDLFSLRFSEEWLAELRTAREQTAEKFSRSFYKEGHPLSVLRDKVDYYIGTTKTRNLMQLFYARRSLEDPQVTTEYCQSRFADQFHIALPNAFKAVEERMEKMDRFAMIIINEDSNYVAGAHLHARNPLDRSKDMRTVTVVLPYKIVEPVDTYVKFQYIDYDIDKTSGHDISLTRDYFLHTEPDPDLPTQDIKLPDVGQYLIIDFNGTECLHWVENSGSKNEYICLLFES